MKAKDFQILKQLSPEAQLKVELKLTVKELFAYAKYFSGDVKPELVEPEQIEDSPVEAPLKEAKSVKQKVILVAVSTDGEEGNAIYFRVKDVADFLNVHFNSVYKWIERGILKIHHKKGKQMYFAKSEVDKLKRKRGSKNRIKI
jgi:excisionase family DNA binding protein